MSAQEQARLLADVEQEIWSQKSLNGTTFDAAKHEPVGVQLLAAVLPEAMDIAGDELKPEKGESAGSYVDRIQTLFESFLGDALREDIAKAFGYDDSDLSEEQDADIDAVHGYLMLSVARTGIAMGFQS